VHDGLLSPGVYSDLDFFGTDAPPLSASRLQTLAEAPYVYFLKYVLGARPLEEPALNDEPWLNRLRKGTLLHEIYERFMRRLDEDGEVPTPDDDSRIDDIVDEVLEEETEAFAPPSPVIEESARRELRQNAAVFLQSEIERSGEYTAERFELGFGFPPHRREDQDIEQAARLSVADRVLPLRGRVDRIDRNPATGGLAAWDYKTGSASSYDEEDPLQDGKTLQWALYAYALESLPDEELQLDGPVEESGYFFANTKEVGARISAHPAQHREEAEKILQQLGELVESGSFPVTPDLKDANDWKWGGYDRLVSDLGSRKKELKDKDYPADRPEPPSF
jgi:RecB family exonuclease